MSILSYAAIFVQNTELFGIFGETSEQIVTNRYEIIRLVDVLIVEWVVALNCMKQLQDKLLWTKILKYKYFKET